MVSRRWTDLHVYDPATMRCQACGNPWVCAGGRERLLAEFEHRDPRHLREMLAETAAIAVAVLKATAPEDIAAIHSRIRDWAPDGSTHG